MSARYKIVVKGEGAERAFILRHLRYTFLRTGWKVNTRCEFESLSEAQDWLDLIFSALYERYDNGLSDTEPLAIPKFVTTRGVVVYAKKVENI